MNPPDRPAKASPATASPWRFWLLAAVAAVTGAGLALLRLDPYHNPDSRAFVALAQALAAGRGLVYREPMLPGLDLHAFRSPGYAVFLAGVWPLGAEPAVVALQGALAGITILLWADLARRIAGRGAGVIAAMAGFALGLTWRLAGQLMSETLYDAMLAAAVVLAFALAERARRGEPWPARHAIALGLVIAATILTRPSGFALPLACAVLLIALPPARRPFALALGVAFVAWLPWPWRNAQVFGAWVPSLTSGGINAWAGAGHHVSDGWIIASRHVELGERGLDRLFWGLTAEMAAARPVAFAWTLVHKLHDYAFPPSFSWRELAHTLMWGPAVAGLWATRRRDLAWLTAPLLPLLVWGGHALVGVVTVVTDRYRFPTDGLVVAMGAIGLVTLSERFRGGRRVLAIVLAVLAGLVLTLTRRL